MNFSNHRNYYSLPKTLRFELKPQGKTLEHIKERDIINSDEKKYNDSFKVKKLLDEFYCEVIESILNQTSLKAEDLNEYFDNIEDKKKLKVVSKNLKESITKEFKKNDLAKNITSSKVLNDLNLNLETSGRTEDIEVLNQFKKYSTYFMNFFESRRFILTGLEVGSISHRLIEENLVTYINNLNVFKKILNSDLAEELKKYNLLPFFNDLSSYNLVLTQEGIDKYNLCISEKANEDGSKIQGINEIINLYNQKNKTKYQFLTQLKKLILSERKTLSFVLDKIETMDEVFVLINDYIDKADLSNPFIENTNLDNIYINNNHIYINNISKEGFDNWSYIKDKINEDYQLNIDSKINNKTFINKRKKYLKNIKFYSVKYLNELTNKDLFEKFHEITEQNILKIKDSYALYEKLDLSNTKELKTDAKTISVIKDLLDSLKYHYDFLKMFNISGTVEEVKDPDFYKIFDDCFSTQIEIVRLYNKVRNFITSKPFSQEKFKLNFNSPTLLNGWDLNKEKDYLGVMLRKTNEKVNPAGTNEFSYYLGIIIDKTIFDIENDNINTNKYYEKMEYKLFPGPNKQLPRMFISAKEYNEALNQDFKEKYLARKHTKDKLDKEFLAEYIEYMQTMLKERYPTDFEFNFRDPSNYEQVDHFYREVENQAYNIKFKRFNQDYIDKCVDEGKLYLFEIYSKDFSEFSKGLPNNQTIYFNNLFSEQNLEEKQVRLNGGGEIFYRRKSIPYIETHPANEAIINKTIGYEKKTSTFPYAIAKDKRYSSDKFFFHFPITLNAVNSNINNINSIINNDISNIEHVIGIDRGERNLLYVVITDLKGNIVKQYNLNEIINEHNEKKYPVNYHALLDAREKKLLEERKSWQTIDTIKELKDGYISQVVNKIKELIFEYNAIVVLENLNFGFKNSRKKVEKQVYQKFETQLIKKLNYIIDKKDINACLNAIQLSNPISTLDKVGNQSGVVFYIPAWNTSNIDPTTGFVNLLFGFKYINETESKEFISKLKDIRYNGNYYEFDIDFNDYNFTYKETKKDWTLCSYGTRIENFRNEEKNSSWDSREIDLTEKFNKLFNEYNINLSSIKNSMLAINQPAFYKEFTYLFKLMLQIRNSKKDTLEDYILSPVKNSSGEFFDSRIASKSLPNDADANGAYNIARKGIILIERIKTTPVGERIDYQITNEEYLQNLQK